MSVAVNAATFEQEVLKAEGPVLVDFWAEWCGPCRMLGPVLESIAEEGSIKVCKVNTDENTALAMQMGIDAIPAVFAFENGKMVGKSVGLVAKQTLLDLFN